MKLRLAKKMCKHIADYNEQHPYSHSTKYTEEQLGRANNRMDRTQTNKQDNIFWNDLMLGLGPEGRASIISSWSPSKALELLMRTPVNKWKGDEAAWNRIFKRVENKNG